MKKRVTPATAALGLVLLPVYLPLKMAGDVLKAERRAKRRKKGRRR